ncbi:glycine-rich RNA-binding protein-like [Papaver somniferum]|uniref:glycine-rich RNA-binding protein-like n=1 Tax=Papaver somniferum TaxID=3469 RepID=UPI000E6FC74D|nr:glycine-rich RNA-binding protein-like [Papaver somniferum]
MATVLLLVFHGKKTVRWRIFSLKESHSAANNFNYDNKLGEGGFGSVYWRQLWDGSQVVVGDGGAGDGGRWRRCYEGDGIDGYGATRGGNGGGGWGWWRLMVVGFVGGGGGGGFMNISWWWVVDDVALSCWLW